MNKTPLVSMIALAQGTVVGSIGIVHVDPDNHTEDGRYTHPVVPEDVAVQLEQARMAKRAEDAVAAQPSGTGGYIGEATLGDPDAPPAPQAAANGFTMAIEPNALRDPAVRAVAANEPGLVQIPAEPDAPVVEAAGADAADAIETGLGDDDPDAPPAPKRGGKK